MQLTMQHRLFHAHRCALCTVLVCCALSHVQRALCTHTIVAVVLTAFTACTCRCAVGFRPSWCGSCRVCDVRDVDHDSRQSWPKVQTDGE